MAKQGSNTNSSPNNSFNLPPIRSVFMTTFDFSNIAKMNLSLNHTPRSFVKRSQYISFPPSLVQKITDFRLKGSNPYIPKTLSTEAHKSLSPITERTPGPVSQMQRYSKNKKKKRLIPPSRIKVCEVSLQTTEDDEEFRDNSMF